MSERKKMENLVESLMREKYVKSDEVGKAMILADRGYFCPNNAYWDSPQSLGKGQTISAPHMHAYALQLMFKIIYNKKGEVKILDVGCGSGYLIAAFAFLCQVMKKEYTIYGIEYIPSLVELSLKNLKKDKKIKDLMEKGVIKIQQGDGWIGLPKDGPFDVIHVGAAAAKIPSALEQQLAKGGRMMIPVGEYSQAIYQVDKDERGKLSRKRILGVRYVPLVNPKGLK